MMPLISIHSQRPDSSRRCSNAYMIVATPSTTKNTISTNVSDTAPVIGSASKIRPTPTAIMADSSDHQKPGACLARNVVISPMMPAPRKIQPRMMVTVMVANSGTKIATASRLHGEGYRKLWARLRFAGVRTSPRRVRRVMRENGLLAPHRVGRTETRPYDGTIITHKVNEMWGTDMTQTITIRDGRANVFVAVEHANSEVVGIHASRSATESNPRHQLGRLNEPCGRSR
jgi:hypothetical protein